MKPNITGLNQTGFGAGSLEDGVGRSGVEPALVRAMSPILAGRIRSGTRAQAQPRLLKNEFPAIPSE